MKKNSLLFLGTLVLIFVFLCSCELNKGGTKEAEQKAVQKSIRKRENIKATLINHYDPILFPPKSFKDKKVFTYDLQKLLTSDPQKLILFSGNLEDISKDGDQFIIQFSTTLIGNDEESDPLRLLLLRDEERVRFHLKCNYENVSQLIEKSPKRDYFQFFEERGFFVVCKITDVQKIVNYTVQGHALGQDEVELEIESPDVFNVKGELVEMVSYERFWERY